MLYTCDVRYGSCWPHVAIVTVELSFNIFFNFIINLNLGSHLVPVVMELNRVGLWDGLRVGEFMKMPSS